jgi:hypothetical protein
MEGGTELLPLFLNEKSTEKIGVACEMIKSFCLAGTQYTMNLYNKKKLQVATNAINPVCS